MSEETETLPADPPMPYGDMVLDISRRLTLLSDAILSPHGSLSLRLEAMAAAELRHHEAQTTMFRAALDELLEIRKRTEDLEQDARDHELAIRVLQSDSRNGIPVQ
jgi:hypothetical protein